MAGKKTILFVSPEAQPFAGTGGLGEVAGSLPVALAAKGNFDVSVVMPLYSAVSSEYRNDFEFIKWFFVSLNWRHQYCGIFKLVRDGVTWYFLDNEYYFARGGIYGYDDDAERFAFFSKAALEMMSQLNYYPDIVHSNDWQSALVPLYNKLIYRFGFKSVFTIHNIEYQGLYDLSLLRELFALPDDAYDYVEWNGGLNLMKGAIEAADVVTTVSPTYAAQLQDPMYGSGLDPIIRNNSYKMRGILNGISYTSYDPATDECLPANFDAADHSKKASDKEVIQQVRGLNKDPNAMLMIVISRLVYHKGMSIIQGAMDRILQENVQLVVLGVGDPGYEDYFRWLSSRYPDKVSVTIKFDNAMSRRLYAGADVLLMPSVSEPCGLTQMIASRYGTIPIVRETGGLRDSVKDCSLGEGNGFTFAGADPVSFQDAVFRALNVYHNKDDWDALVTHALGLDFSWKKSASEYEDLYREIIQ